MIRTVRLTKGELRAAILEWASREGGAHFGQIPGEGTEIRVQGLGTLLPTELREEVASISWDTAIVTGPYR